MDVIFLVAAIVSIIILTIALARRERRLERTHGYDALAKSRLKPASMLSAYIVCYVLFLLLIGLSIAISLRVPSTMLLLLAAFRFPSEWNRLLYLLLVSLGCILLFGVVIVAESYLRTGVRKRILMRRFTHLLFLLGALYAIDVLIRVSVRSYLNM